MKDKIVFFGSGKYVLPIIKRIDESFEIEQVITTEDEHGQVVQYSRELQIEAYPINQFSQDVLNTLSEMESKVAVLASFGLIIPQKVLDMFPLGIINIHPSYLPKFRGPTPVQSAILDGEKTTGVSIIKLDSEVDHGPILIQKEQDIEDTDTADSLYTKLFAQGAELLTDILPKYISGKVELTEQDNSLASFTKHLTRNSGYIDIHNPPSTDALNRIIRAYFPWPGTWFKVNLNGSEKVVKLFPDNKIQVEGKNIMTLKDFANGYTEGKEILGRLGLN